MGGEKDTILVLPRLERTKWGGGKNEGHTRSEDERTEVKERRR